MKKKKEKKQKKEAREEERTEAKEEEKEPKKRCRMWASLSERFMIDKHPKINDKKHMKISQNSIQNRPKINPKSISKSIRK